MRRIYGTLLRLHPFEFRDRFGDEMELIFEEAANSRGKTLLVGDALVSLGRQWFLRRAAWKWIGACIGATASLIFNFGSFIRWNEVWLALRSCF
jgi:hypothetical protein